MWSVGPLLSFSIDPSLPLSFLVISFSSSLIVSFSISSHDPVQYAGHNQSTTFSAPDVPGYNFPHIYNKKLPPKPHLRMVMLSLKTSGTKTSWYLISPNQIICWFDSKVCMDYLFLLASATHHSWLQTVQSISSGTLSTSMLLHCDSISLATGDCYTLLGTISWGGHVSPSTCSILIYRMSL